MAAGGGRDAPGVAFIDGTKGLEEGDGVAFGKGARLAHELREQNPILVGGLLARARCRRSREQPLVHRQGLQSHLKTVSFGSAADSGKNRNKACGVNVRPSGRRFIGMSVVESR